MFQDKLVSELVNSNKEYTDHIGVEIEVELDKPLQEENYTGAEWRVEHDGSLKGNGYEYVLRKPLPPAKAKKAVRDLLKRLKDAGYEVINNGRAGVHVHVNVGDLTVKQATNFTALTLTHEDLLANFCGEYRTGNLFCLRMRDAEYVIDKFTEALVREDLRILKTDAIRYAFLNFKALPQYGSLEFRGMRSDGDAEAICNWISLLCRLKEKSRNIDNPIQVVAEMSHREPEGFVADVMGDLAPLLPRYVGWEWEMLESIRRVQLFAYVKEW